MEIQNVMLVPEAADPTAEDPVLVSWDAEGSCLLLTIQKGQQKASFFMYCDGNGKVWGRINNALKEGQGENGEEISLFEEPEVKKEEPLAKSTGAEEQPVGREEPSPGSAMPLPDETEPIPEGVEVPF